MREKAICLTLCALLVCLCMTEAVTAQPAQVKPTSPVTVNAPRKFVAYYFHSNFRCNNCKKIEQYAREAVEKYFADQLKTGELVLKVVNTDLPANQHFIEDYQLYTSSLVIAAFQGETQLAWKILTGVWNYLGDPEAFYDYVKTEIQKHMELS